MSEIDASYLAAVRVSCSQGDGWKLPGEMAMKLCDEIDRLREDNGDLAALAGRATSGPTRTVSLEDLEEYLAAVDRAAAAEAIIEACGCNTADGWAADAEFKRMQAALRAALDLHHNNGHGYCTTCEVSDRHGGYRAPWPCDTVQAITHALGGEE